MVHAGAIARFDRGDWGAALIFGPSGAGKSDLALRALAAGWRLVSDDYSVLWTSGGCLWVRAPDSIAGRIEARGLGIEPEPCLPFARACLAVTLVEDVERLPEPGEMVLEGVKIPALELRAREDSALWKLERALSTRGLKDPLADELLGTRRA